MRGYPALRFNELLAASLLMGSKLFLRNVGATRRLVQYLISTSDCHKSSRALYPGNRGIISR